MNKSWLTLAFEWRTIKSFFIGDVHITIGLMILFMHSYRHYLSITKHSISMKLEQPIMNYYRKKVVGYRNILRTFLKEFVTSYQASDQ